MIFRKDAERAGALSEGGSAVDLRARRAAEARRARRWAVALSAAFALAVVVLTVVLALAAGAVSGEGGAVDSGAAPEVATGHEVTDALGRCVTVPDDPARIAVFDSFSGEMAIMAGAGDRIVGLPAGVKSDRMLMAMKPALNPDAATLSGSAVNIETLMALDCDVALVKTSLSADEAAKLDAAGIPYVAVGYTSVDEQMAAMELVGEVCGRDPAEKAARLVAYYREVAALVAEHAAALEQEGVEPVRVYHAINDVLLTDGAGSLGADWIQRVGCVDVSAGQEPTSGTDYATTLEQIYVWQPELIVCNARDAALAFSQDTAWAQLPAVASGNVRIIPTGATRWGQRGSVETYLAMLWLGTVAYPEAYADVDLRATVGAYYRDFFEVEVTDELWESMLAGTDIRATGTGDGSGGGTQ